MPEIALKNPQFLQNPQFLLPPNEFAGLTPNQETLMDQLDFLDTLDQNDDVLEHLEHYIVDMHKILVNLLRFVNFYAFIRSRQEKGFKFNDYFIENYEQILKFSIRNLQIIFNKIDKVEILIKSRNLEHQVELVIR
jgi:hypothetical protein